MAFIFSPPNPVGSGVYQITNLENGRIYIGSSHCFKTRWQQHSYALLKGKHTNTFLQNDFNKGAGTSNLQFTIVEVCNGNKSDRLVREEHWIKTVYDHQDKCYNLCDRAISREGCKSKDPKSTSEKHRQATLKLWQDPTYHQNQVEIQGKSTREFWSVPENKERATMAIRKACSKPEYKEKLSKALTAYYQDPANLEKRRELASTTEHREKIGKTSKTNWRKPEYREKMTTSRKASWAQDPHRKEKARAKMVQIMEKTYCLRTPEGEIVEITNLRAYCKASPILLIPNCLSKVARGIIPCYKGWTKP